MANVELITEHLGNLRSPLLKGELNVDATITLNDFVDIWLTTFKKNTVKLASYNRLICSKRALENYPISRMAIGEIDFFSIQSYVNELVEKGYSMSGIKKTAPYCNLPS